MNNANNIYITILFYVIHFYFITLFEVLFYLYYILPYEQSLLVNLFNLRHNKYDKFIHKYNVSITASTFYELEHCGNGERRIDDANEPLYRYCYYYIGFIQVALLIVFFYDVHYTYGFYFASINNEHSQNHTNNDKIKNYGDDIHGSNNSKCVLNNSKFQSMLVPITTNKLTKNIFSFSSVDTQEHIEMAAETNDKNKDQRKSDNINKETETQTETKDGPIMDLDLDLDLDVNVDIEMGNLQEEEKEEGKKEGKEEPIEPTENETCEEKTIFVRYYWTNSLFVEEFIRTLYFICIIGIFEFLFFTQIVDNFKVFDLKMILCNLLK